MTKSRVFLFLGIIMTIIAVVFVSYALQHPELSAPIWVVSLYPVYMVAMIIIFLFSVLSKKK